MRILAAGSGSGGETNLRGGLAGHIDMWQPLLRVAGPSRKPPGVTAPEGFINGRGLQKHRGSLMVNVNHPLAFGRFLNALLKNTATIGRFLGVLLQSKAATAITPLLPTDFSFRLAVRCRWGQKP